MVHYIGTPRKRRSLGFVSCHRSIADQCPNGNVPMYRGPINEESGFRSCKCSCVGARNSRVSASPTTQYLHRQYCNTCIVGPALGTHPSIFEKACICSRKPILRFPAEVIGEMLFTSAEIPSKVSTADVLRIEHRWSMMKSPLMPLF